MTDFNNFYLEPLIEEEEDPELPKPTIDTFDTLRILRANGFFGVISPITRNLPGTTAQTAANYTTPFFIADRRYEVIEVFERHEVIGSDAGAVTVQVRKVPSGTAPASGTNILTAGISLKATANTNQKGTLVATFTSSVSNKVLVRNDSLTLVSSGTLTAVEGVTVTVILRAI